MSSGWTPLAQSVLSLRLDNSAAFGTQQNPNDEHVMQKLTKKGKVDNMCSGTNCCPKRQKTAA